MSKYFSSATTEYRVDVPIDKYPIDPRKEWDEPGEDEIQCYLDGEVYGFVLYSRPVNSTDETDWKEIDSVWGFYTWNPEKDIMESGYIDILSIQLVDEKEFVERFADALVNV